MPSSTSPSSATDAVVLLVDVPPDRRGALEAPGVRLRDGDLDALASPEIGVVVVGPAAAQPVAIAQAAHRARRDVEVVIIAAAGAEDAVRGSLKTAPYVPQGVQVTTSGPAAREAISDAVERARRRRRLGSQVEAMVRQVAAAPPAPPAGAVLAHVLDELPVGVVVLDGDGRLLRFNRAARDALLQAGDERIGEPLANALSPEHRAPITALVAEADEAARRVELEVATPGGARHLEIVGSARTSAGSRTVLLVVQDVTERITHRKAIERNAEVLRRRNEELARTNTLLEEFARVVAHDLREPLRAVTSYSQLLDRRYRERLDESAREYLGYMLEAATRMQGLITDLLRYAQAGAATTLAPVSLDDVVTEALANLGERVSETAATVTREPLPVVRGDRTQLVQLFQNLLSNALKFRDGPAKVRVSAAKGDGEVVVTVADEGIGMDMRHAERVFEVFQRLHTRGTYEGTGIGLAIVKRIVEAHHGRVWIASTPGRGTAVHVALPEP